MAKEIRLDQIADHMEEQVESCCARLFFTLIQW